MNRSKNPSLNVVKNSSSILYLSVVQCLCAAGGRRTKRTHKASIFSLMGKVFSDLQSDVLSIVMDIIHMLQSWAIEPKAF